ncbi:MAG: hypothetical protein ACYSW7_06400, partial [Planctomycetota bacterium]
HTIILVCSETHNYHIRRLRMPFCYKKKVFINKNPQSVPAKRGPSTHAGPPKVGPVRDPKNKALTGRA